MDTTTLTYLNFLIEVLGTTVFATTGVLAAAERRLDLFGVIVVGIASAVGGGTLRDLILGRLPVFWVEHTHFASVAILSSIATYVLARRHIFPHKALLVADAIGLSFFTIVGAQIALDLGHSSFIAVLTGMMTGVFGGIVRDVLTAVKPLIFQKEIYATATLAGAVVFVILKDVLPPDLHKVSTCAGVSTVLIIRLAAIRWNLQLPQSLSLIYKGAEQRPEK